MKTFSTALWQDFMCSWLGWSFGARFWISFISRGSFVILCMGAERRDWRVCFASISSASRCLWKFSLIFLGERKWEGGRGEDTAKDRKGRRREVKKQDIGGEKSTTLWYQYVCLTHSSPVLPGDVSGLHSSVDSTQTCSQPTIGRSKNLLHIQV